MGNRLPALHREVDYSVESHAVPAGLELSEQQQNELVRIFCGSKHIDPREVEALVSSKPGHKVGANSFFPQNGKSPFLEAARAGKLVSLKFMLERYRHAIDVNGRGRVEKLAYTLRTQPHPTITLVHYDVTALIASCFGTFDCEVISLEVVKYLISKGALVNLASCHGTTPLMAAAEVGNVKVLQYLVQCGADVNAVCIRGTTALHHAARGGSMQAVKFLIKKGIPVNYQDHCGRCAIHVAAVMGKREVVQTLIAEGATSFSSQGSPMDPKYVPSPIVLAASQGYRVLVEDLRKHCSMKLCFDAYLMFGIFQYDHFSSFRWSGWNKIYFKVAFDLLAECSDPVEYLPPCVAYGYRTEVETLEQCESLLSGEKQYQALIIKERCLGSINGTLRQKMIELALSWSEYMPSHVEAIALLSRVMSSVISEVDHFPLEYIAHAYNGNYLTLWDIPLRWTLEKYSDCPSKDKWNIDLTFFLQFIARGLEYVKSSIQKVSCAHGCSRDDISMLTLHGLRFLCVWLQQEKANGRNPVLGGSDCDNIGQKFTSAYLYAPNDSTLLCQALSPKLLYAD